MTAIEDNIDQVKSDVLDDLCTQLQLSDNASLSDVGLLGCP